MAALADKLEGLRVKLAHGLTPADLWPFADHLRIPAVDAAVILGPREKAGAPPPRPAVRRQLTPPPAPPSGPGRELKTLLTELGLSATQGCGCDDKAALMDRNGAAWCRGHVDEIADWLRAAAGKAGWLTALGVAPALIVRPWFRPAAPFRSVVEEAIRRAEAKAGENP